MPRFSKKTMLKLKRAGWRESRKTDINKTIEGLDKSGCFLSRDMERFLSEFQDLCLKYPNNEELFDFGSFFHNISSERCKVLKGLLGENAFQIGVMYNSNFLIVITENNKMYAMTPGEHDIFLLGESFDEGVEFVCTYGMSSNLAIYESRRVR